VGDLKPMSASALQLMMAGFTDPTSHDEFEQDE
jgi:hypothetical protein